MLAGLLAAIIGCALQAAPAPSPSAGKELGNLFQGFGSANWSGGRIPGNKFAISFIARHSKPVAYIWICWKTSAGYAQGNYGAWSFELQSDNPHGHLPSGDILMRLDNIRQPPEGYFLLKVNNIALVAGRHYHLVMYNTDPNPEQNWSSPNTIMSLPDEPWRGEGVMNFDGTAWTPWGSPDNPYALKSGSRAAYLLQFTDDTVEGMPYYSASERRLFGQRYEGEQFTWWSADVRIGQLGFCVSSVGKPAGELQFALEKADGTPISRGIVASPRTVKAQPAWSRVELRTPLTLKRGQRYRLYLLAPSCMDEVNCYATYLPYSSERVPGWPELTWGGRQAGSISHTREQGWKDSPIPADLTFSMVTAP